MNLMVAPEKSFLTSFIYISKPLVMSLPTWAKGPVIGARKPTRNSSAVAPDVGPRLVATATHPAISIGPTRLSHLLVMAPTPSSGCRHCGDDLIHRIQAETNSFVGSVACVDVRHRRTCAGMLISPPGR